MTRSKGRGILSIFLAAVTAIGVLTLPSHADTEKSAAQQEQERVSQSILDVIRAISYDDYDELHSDAPRATKEVSVYAADAYDAETTTSEVAAEEHDGVRALKTGSTGKVTLKINVPETARYVMKIEYCTVSDSINAVERILYINDKVPFSEARLLQMKKLWRYELVEQEDGTMRFPVDGSGNELRPTVKPEHAWQEYVVSDRDGLHNEPLEFYFEAGENVLTFQAEREEAYFGKITLCPKEDKRTYEDLKAEYASRGYGPGSDVIKFQAETPSAVSDGTYFPNNNRTSAISEPQHPTKYLLNGIGDGSSGYANGQWTEYTFNVETPGLYTVVFRYKQSFSSGVFVSRKILIDGESPCVESERVRFYSGNDWRVEETKYGDETLEFYLDRGEHTLRVETTLGDMADIIRRVASVQKNANADYLQILRLTGANPDEYRDYGFKRVMPETVKDLLAESKILNQCITELREFSKSRSEMTAMLEQAANLLEKMGSDEDEIAKNLADLKTQLGTVGSWVITAKDQPLQFDYIVVQPAGSSLPRANANFFQSMGYEFGQFFGSFFTDYGAMGVSDLSDVATSSLEAWTASGRDQAQIIRTQINNKFAPQTGTAVNLKLVASDALLPAILAGIGPDVALEGMAGTTTTGASGDIMDYALRGALVPIYGPKAENGGFADFPEIKKRFSPSAFINLDLYGTIYGLPASQEWAMLFCRTDVLAALELEIPETWDDLFAMIPVLQFNNMLIGIAPDLDLLATFTYQRGSTIWADDGMRVNFDSNACLESFDEISSLYTQYGLPIAYSFANRFRTGEIPVGIGGYAATYNSIVIYATELSGLWDFAPVPGRRQADGTINRTVQSSSNPVSMPKDCRDKERAWEFMKWYTDKDFQSSYGNELVALMGEAAKYATANLEALSEMSWTPHEYEQLMIQAQSLDGYQSYPGKYFLKRYFTFSIQNVYNELTDPIETLLGYVPTINKEITRKRNEFGLESLEVGQTLGTKRLDEAKALLDEISDADRDKYAPLFSAFEKAYAKRNADMIRSAAEGFEKADSELFADAIVKLNEAAAAFDTYD